jgi:hypothetical protein
VVEVGEGDAATLTFDAIPGLELPGKVSRIKDLGENVRGIAPPRLLLSRISRTRGCAGT